MDTGRARLAASALAVLSGGCLDSVGPHLPEEAELQRVKARATVDMLTEDPPTVRVSVVLHNEGAAPAIYHYCTISARVYREGATRPSYEATPRVGCTYGRGRRTLRPGARVKLRDRPVVVLPARSGLPRTYVFTVHLSSLSIGLWALDDVRLHAGRVTVEDLARG